MTATSPIPRLTQQVIRNNIADYISNPDTQRTLTWGLDEYFEIWGALFPYENGGDFLLHPNEAMDETECQALQKLVDELNEASRATKDMPAEEFVGTSWPQRIETAARAAFDVMSVRGRYCENEEELEPSLRF